MTRKPEKVAKTQKEAKKQRTDKRNHEAGDGIERVVQIGQAIGRGLKTK